MAGYEDPMNGFRTLGRLLWAGLIAGGVIDGTVGTLALHVPADAASYRLLGLCLGALLGIFAGLVVQAVTYVALVVLRKVRPSLSRSAMRFLLTALPVPTACALAWSVASSSDGPLARRPVITTVALVLALGAWRLAATWCLAPLIDRRDRTRCS
jgi:hypothetical protein